MDEGLQEYTALAPVVFEQPEILILTSMPSVDSHLANFYYADPDNRFWPLLGAIYQMPCQTQSERLAICQQNHIALWSVVKSCLRHLSREDTMQDIQLNNMQEFLNEYPSITRVLCVSHRTENLFNECAYVPNGQVFYVPSPSAADLYYDSVEKLMPEWQRALGQE